LIKHKCHGGDFIGADHDMRVERAQAEEATKQARADTLSDMGRSSGANGFMSGTAEPGSFAAAVHAQQQEWQNQSVAELKAPSPYWELMKAIATAPDVPLAFHGGDAIGTGLNRVFNEGSGETFTHQSVYAGTGSKAVADAVDQGIPFLGGVAGVGQAVGQGAVQSARLGTEPVARAEATALESAKPAGLGPTPGSLSVARQTPNQTFGLNAVNETTAASPQAPLAIHREVNLEFTLEPNAAVQSEVDALRRIGANNRSEGFASENSVLLQSKAEANAYRRLQEMQASTPGAHYLEKHGAQLDLQSQFDRAAFGLNPTTGVQQFTPLAATRFLSHRDQLNTIMRAENIYQRTSDLGLAQEPIRFQSIVGSGYQRSTLEYGEQYSGQAFIKQSTGKAITAFPVWGK
jgi:hypothetical protein